MEQPRDASSDNSQYRICVEGILDPRWAAWFDALAIIHETNETLLLTGRIDQAALYGGVAMPKHPHGSSDREPSASALSTSATR